MFCPKCGRENDNTALFCQWCRVAFTTVEYAGFWKRFLAYIIDYIIGIVFVFLVSFTVMIIWEGLLERQQLFSWLPRIFGSDDRMAWVLGQFGGFVLWWLYYAFMESSVKQATLGKMALGIIVTDLVGNKISFGKASGRFFGKIISALIVCVGFIMAGVTEKKQALHDIMAGCLVVKKK